MHNSNTARIPVPTSARKAQDTKQLKPRLNQINHFFIKITSGNMNLDLIQKIKSEIKAKKEEIAKLNQMLVDLVLGDDDQAQPQSYSKPIKTIKTTKSKLPTYNPDSVAAVESIRNLGTEIKRETITDRNGQKRELITEYIGKKSDSGKFIDSEMPDIDI